MAEKLAPKEPTIEEMMAAANEPTIEEMMAAANDGNIIQPPDFAQQPIEKPTNFGPVETVSRGARQMVKGATLGFLEKPFGYAAGIGAEIDKLIFEGKLPEAGNLIENLNSYYKQDWERQKKFQEQVPGATALEMTGGMFPGTLAAKAAQVGMRAGMGVVSSLEQAAKAGALGLGAYKAAEISALPSDQTPTLPQQAQQIAESAVLGGIAGPAVGLGIEAAARAPGLIKGVATSAPVLKFAAALLGPPSKVMKQYAEQAADLGRIPSVEEVNLFFEQVRNQTKQLSQRGEADLAAAKSNLESLETQVTEQAKAAQGEIKSKLLAAKENLRVLQEDLRFEQQSAQQDLAAAKTRLAEQTQDPSMGPYVATVNEALDVFKDKVVEQSLAARSLLRDDSVFDPQQIVSAWEKEIKKLRIQGTSTAKSESAEQAISAIQREIARLNSLPKQISGQQLKDKLQGYDKDYGMALLSPGRFGKDYDNALKSVRKQTDTMLKDANPEYQAAIKPAAELADKLEKIVAELSGPSAITSKLRQAVDDPRIEGHFKDLERVTQLPVTAPIVETQTKRAAAKGIAQTPEYQNFQRAKAMYQMAQAEKFNRQVFEAVKDTEVAQQIIALRSEMKKYSDPEYVQAEIARATEQGQISLEQARSALDALQQQRDAAAKWMRQIIGENATKPADLTMAILRNTDSPYETAKATKIIDAVTNLPTPLFNEVFDNLMIGSPKEARKMFESLRVDDAMNKARTNGSKGVNLMRAIFIGAGAGGAAGGLIDPQTAAILGAFGAMAGAMRDEYGGQVAKVFLRNAARLQGVPTMGKLASAAAIKNSASFRNAIAIQLNDMVTSMDAGALYSVSEAGKPAVERDIKQSKMSAVERAKALNELNQLGGVSGKYLQKIMLDSAPPSTQSMMPEASMSLEADKPDMLERLSKRTARAEEKGLRGVVSRLREA